MSLNKFLTVSGYIFLIWGILDLAISYFFGDFKELYFLWFCSIALFLLAFGLLLKDEMLLNSFLAGALVVQPLWIIDYASNVFFNQSFLDLTSYVLEPSFSLLQFINTFRHLFMIPFGFLAVFLISKKSKKSYFFIPVYALLLLGFSYAFTPGYNNTNCVFEPCFDFFDIGLSGFSYFVFFFISVTMLILLVNLGLNRILEKTKRIRYKKRYKKLVFSIFISLLMLSFATAVTAVFRYFDVPHYSCVSESENLRCEYFYGEGVNQTVVYSIGNFDENGYVCEVYMKINPGYNGYTKIVENSYIEPDKRYKISRNLPYPEVDTEIKLRSECDMFG